MTDQPQTRTIYRRPGRPGHAGNAPTLETIQRHDGTLNVRRLRNASPLMSESAHSRRVSGRGFLLLGLVVLVVIALVALATSRPAPAHGQYMAPTVTPPTPPTPAPTPTVMAIIDPWPAMECAPGAACYYALLPLVANGAQP